MSSIGIAVVLAFFVTNTPSSFKKQQLQNPRVKAAYAEKASNISGRLQQLNIKDNQLRVFLRAYKQENQLELWGKNRNDSEFQLIKTYHFCATSGDLGPKLQQGDGQIPEGLYYINRYNPWSSFHLSLGLNYPNKIDKIRSKGKNPGGDIFIHGDCVTIGCIPITDDLIKELYIYTLKAKLNGQTRVPVHIFPAKLEQEKLEELKAKYKGRPKLVDFWKNLQVEYLLFKKNRTLERYYLSSKGTYVFPQ